MALFPIYTAEINTVGDEAYLYDITGIYDAANNDTGWGTPNDAPNSLFAASVTVFDYLNQAVTTINILANYQAFGTTATEKMLVATIPWSYVDGYYLFVITLETDIPLSSSSFETELLALPNAKNAKNKLWLRAFNNGNCNCNSKDAREAMRAEIIYRSIEANSEEITAANAAKICELAVDVLDIANNRSLIL